MSDEEKKPDEVMSREDRVWLFSRIFVMLLANYLIIFAVVLTSSSVSFLVANQLDSNITGFATGLTLFISGMAGRELAYFTLAQVIFSKEDVEALDKMDAAKKL